MIYKFIDVNGNEITVNSISSLQGLVDSDTIKKDTKVKAGLRGNWITAEDIPELVFNENIAEEETSEDIAEPDEDIRSFITKDKIEKQTEEVPKQDPLEQKQEDVELDASFNIEKLNETIKKEVVNEIIETEEKDNSTNEKKLDTSDYYTEKFVENRDSKKTTKGKEKKRDKNYDDENVIGLSLKSSWKICFSKIFIFTGRASRSEFWKFYPLFAFLYFILSFFVMFMIVLSDPYIPDNALDAISWVLSIPAWLITISVTVRRLHDTDRTGWWILIAFIPVIGLILLFFVASKGTEGKNRFGDYPLKLKKY